MKRMSIAFGLIFCCSLLASAAAPGGKSFEGVISYKITYPDSKQSEGQMAMYPKLFSISVKDLKARTEMQVGAMNNIQIIDYNNKTIVTLYNMMGNKFAVKQSAAEIEKELAKDAKPTVEVTNETKTIAGYLCKKAIVTVNDDGMVTRYEAWFTRELGSKMVNFDNPLYKDIDGVLLEFLFKAHEITMKFTATSVEKKSLDDKDFQIPSDYTVTTQDELKNKILGGSK